MKILKPLSDLSTDTVVTIGKFEGLHRGHRHLLGIVAEQAAAHNLKSLLLSFVPHPAKILRDSGYKPLFTGNEQAHLLSQTKLDYWYPLALDRGFAAMPPRDFCDFLYTNFRCRVIVVGENFRFGHEREGTPETLREWGCEKGVSVVTVPVCGAQTAPVSSVLLDVQPAVSSSAIRAALEAGDTETAAEALGFPFFIIGTVQEGAKLGRTLGFPTVNLHPPADKFLPKSGVYLTSTFAGGRKYKSVTNLGNSPTINAYAPAKAETHILDFDGDLYNSRVLITFNKYLRPQRAFGSVEELKAQISDDIRNNIRMGG